jgi:hypothetical protein
MAALRQPSTSGPTYYCPYYTIILILHVDPILPETARDDMMI